MATLNAKIVARDSELQLVHAIRAQVTANSPGIAGGQVVFGTLPNGAAVIGTAVITEVAFTGAGSTLSIGNLADSGAGSGVATYQAAATILAAGIVLGALPATAIPVAAAANAAPIDRQLTYTFAGPPTAGGPGLAEIIVWYVLPLKPATNP
jgi:hypothetical protein